MPAPRPPRDLDVAFTAPLDRALLEVTSEAGVTTDVLTGQIRRGDRTGRRGLWAAATELLGSELGFTVGARLSHPRWAGTPALVVRAPHDLHDGLERLQAMRRFMLGSTQVAVRHRGERVALVFDPPGRPWPGPIAEALLVATLTAGHRWTGVEFPAVRWSFQHAPSKESVRALEALGSDVRGGQAETSFEFSKSHLELPFLHADPMLVEVLQELLPRRAPTVGLVGAVRVAVRANLGRSLVTADETARALGMSARTLHRRLQRHGVSIQQLIEGERVGLIKDLLTEPRLSLCAIADRVGYSDERALRRAFTRATGVTPSEFRRALERAK